MFRRTLISMTAATALAAPLAVHAQDDMTIPAVAEEAGNFTTLLAAVEAAGLGETLSGEGPFTVLAPTDDAFGELPDGMVEALTMEENIDTLTQILQAHVIEGSVMSSDLEDGMEAETMNGSYTVDLSGEAPMIGDATVVQPDVEASNGVIHAIDTVIVPEGVELPEVSM